MPDTKNFPSFEELTRDREKRAKAIAEAGGLEKALQSGAMPKYVDVSLSEAIVLGLLRQGVTRFLVVLGHGSTEIGEALRVYAKAGLVKVYPVRSEIEASHAAAALRWVAGEKAAVVTSIGPGALQALAASLVPASDGLGVWYLFGDETSEDEGFNMQQIPRHEQNLFLRLCSTLGEAYSLHTPGSLNTALRRGLVAVDHPHRQRPFYLLLPMNTQSAWMPQFNLDELPLGAPPALPAAVDDGSYSQAADWLLKAKRVVIRAGGGAREAGLEIAELADLADGVVATSPLVSGVIVYHHPRNMTVGGSKGSICGNYAMEEGDLLVVVGSRSVCQSDSSRTAYPKAEGAIHVNADWNDAMHYNKTIPMIGDAAATLRLLNEKLRQRLGGKPKVKGESEWLKACRKEKERWNAYKAERYNHPKLYDEKWKRELLTQPAAIKTATDWARKNGAVAFFDAGDVQANGFQIVEDDRLGQTFTETGASYMGFGVCSLLAAALADKPFYGLALTGDGSFMMNPQILIDGVEHGARGCILLLDNRRMAAISGLQTAQYGEAFATDDRVEIDYMAMAGAVQGVAAFHGGYSIEELIRALDRAKAHDGLSLVHLPVYYGSDPLGGLGAWGRWNVGNWVQETQALRHKIGL
ncbi:MAG: thiamine pyrophosphate-binding protein [Myxococcales bacterium]|nr:MAG: thiamine pyrophosphate-binding protein [Myxococcales bacterium]